jgi:hypothetical protein
LRAQAMSLLHKTKACVILLSCLFSAINRLFQMVVNAVSFL